MQLKLHILLSKNFYKADMSINVDQNTVAFIKDRIKECDLTDIVVRFHGGELLARFDIIKLIMDGLEDTPCSVSFSMTTNATLILKRIVAMCSIFNILSDSREI